MKAVIIAAVLLSAPSVFGQTTTKKENGGVATSRPVQETHQNTNEGSGTPTLNSGEKQMRTENPNNQNNITPVNKGARPMVRSKEILKNPELKED